MKLSKKAWYKFPVILDHIPGITSTASKVGAVIIYYCRSDYCAAPSGSAVGLYADRLLPGTVCFCSQARNRAENPPVSEPPRQKTADAGRN